MDKTIENEKQLYFKDKKQFFISRLTNEHNYLLWKYVFYLRREERAKYKFAKYYYRRKKNNLGAELGILIYAGTCDSGLHIWHYGSVIISGYARIGRNCSLHGQNCIGNNGKDIESPIIGNNVDIGVGAVVIGNVYIADNVKIGAGAVVTKSCYEKGAVLIGVPAQIKNNKD
ncbi:serine acetyltransferase [Clostridium sp. MCC353]|uniref:serine acetyltransferase n=1 Tax=Clostridium sp. MCC353 TaxID=2592646 RepID=UPI001C0380F4|nr:serine acetyltransferase [Clostridium sp. MCC353]MBT9777080.1 serine acetyltransferase [Clostridium sp. MCC353]